MLCAPAPLDVRTSCSPDRAQVPSRSRYALPHRLSLPSCYFCVSLPVTRHDVSLPGAFSSLSCTCSRRYVASGCCDACAEKRPFACRRHLRWTVSFHDCPGSSLSATKLLQPRPGVAKTALYGLGATVFGHTYHTTISHTIFSHTALSHATLSHNLSSTISTLLTHTFSHTHTTLTHNLPSDTTLSHTTLSNTTDPHSSLAHNSLILTHNLLTHNLLTSNYHPICLPPSPFSFLPFPSRLQLSFATYYKKLTCGVIRSFNDC